MRALNGDPNAVYTLASTGERGFNNGTGNVAKFNKPSGVAVLTSGVVMVADTANHVLRKILLPPVIASLNPNQGNPGTAVTITGNRFDERGPSFNTVRFAAASGTVTATVTTATRTQLNVTVPAAAVTGPVTVQTQGGTSNGLIFTVGSTQPPAIADFNPKSGPIGTLVTLTGTNLKVGTADPVVTFAGSSGRIQALLTFSGATEVRAVVPNAAVTGVIDLTTSAGTATTSQPFVVQPSQDFAITLAPSSTTAVQGSTAIFEVSLTSPQTTFTQLVSLTMTGLPSGAAATFSPAQITAGAKSTLKIKLTPSLSPTSYSFTVQGKTQIDGSETTRTVGGSFSVMAAGSTTLAGRVLSTEGVAIPNATVSAPAPSGPDVTATTDGAGNFLLIGLQAGPKRPIFIQPPQGSVYPAIKEPADVAQGQANTVPYIFYLPAIEPLNTPINPNGPTDVTNAKVPNLKMTIPQGVRLRVLGSSADVTHVSITTVPVDRTPAPLPGNVATALVYSSQPGNACIVDGNNQCSESAGRIPVTYPNLSGANPGTRVPLWAFDHNTVEWYQYGMGTVSADGKTIVPDAGVGLKDFSWHFPAVDVSNVPWYDCLNKWMFPVHLASGMKMESMTDIAFGGERGGLALTRIYTNDQASKGSIYAFGRWTHNYDIRLTGDFLLASGQAGRMLLPDQSFGSLFSFSRTETSGARVFTTIGTPGQIGDELRRLTDGTFEYRNAQGGKLRFDSSGRLTSIVDFNGNTTTLTYSGNNLSQITDAVGRSITLSYDSNNRIQTAQDPLGRITQYSYDSGGQLTRVTAPLNNITQYGYDIGANAGSAYTRYSYTGREFDAATGLLYYRARWYNSQQGRFLSEDPIGFDAGMNLYGYVGNSPLNYTDPSGKFAWVLLGVGGNVLSGMLISRAFGQCYGWRDMLLDLGLMGAGKGFKVARKFIRGKAGWGGELGEFLGHGFGPMRHFGSGARRFGGSADDFGRGFGKGGADFFGSGSRGPSADFGGGGGGGPRHGGGGGGTGSGSSGSNPVNPYEVGQYNDLKSRSIGDALDVHHVPQAHPASKVIQGYDPYTAPAITLPRLEHIAIRPLKGPYGGSLRDLVAKDIRNLRKYTNAPNSAPFELLRLIRQTYPGAL